MRPWLFRLSFSHLLEFPGRTVLGVLGIALGTAVYLSISLAGTSALRSFSDGVLAVAGKAEWRLTSPGAPLPESLFLQVRGLPEVEAAAPVVESVLQLAGPHQGPALLLGIDPFSEGPFRSYQFSGDGEDAKVLVDFLTHPQGVLVSAPLAHRLKLKKGDNLPVIVGSRKEKVTVVWVCAASSNVPPTRHASAARPAARYQATRPTTAAGAARSCSRSRSPRSPRAGSRPSTTRSHARRVVSSGLARAAVP